jgi:ubiquitin-conjugating enzyme E2 D/E
MRILEDNPIQNISAGPANDDIFHWISILNGPEGTPYHGGFFYLKIHFPDSYPFRAPILKMQTKIYHPHITSKGAIIYNDRLWSPSSNIAAHLLAIYDFIFYPEVEVASGLLIDIATEFQQNRNKFDETAKNWTDTYAT